MAVVMFAEKAVVPPLGSALTGSRGSVGMLDQPLKTVLAYWGNCVFSARNITRCMARNWRPLPA